MKIWIKTFLLFMTISLSFIFVCKNEVNALPKIMQKQTIYFDYETINPQQTNQEFYFIGQNKPNLSICNTTRHDNFDNIHLADTSCNKIYIYKNISNLDKYRFYIYHNISTISDYEICVRAP